MKSQQELSDLREAIHRYGADHYPTRWMVANQRAVAAIQKVGARVDDPVIRTLAPLIALKVLQLVMPCERVSENPQPEDIKQLIKLKIIKNEKPTETCSAG
jgi:hypothetical protein